MILTAHSWAAVRLCAGKGQYVGGYTVMKKIIAALCAAVLCLSVFLMTGCGSEESDVPDGMVLASSEDADYIMYVPEQWKVDKSTLYTSAYFSSGDATSISAAAYGMNFTDKTADDWWSSFEEQMKSVYQNVSDAEKEAVTLGGIEGNKYTFTADLNGQTYNYIISAVLKDNYIYYITYTSTPDYCEKHLEELESVLKNFSFK